MKKYGIAGIFFMLEYVDMADIEDPSEGFPILTNVLLLVVISDVDFGLRASSDDDRLVNLAVRWV